MSYLSFLGYVGDLRGCDQDRSSQSWTSSGAVPVMRRAGRYPTSTFIVVTFF